MLSLGPALAGCVGTIGGLSTDDERPDDEQSRRQEYELPACPDGKPRPLAHGLRIREVALYQTIKIPLYRDGKWLDKPTVPIVRGKRALVRVFVDTLEGYEPHEVSAVLRLDNGKQMRGLGEQRKIEVTSSDEADDSTFNILVDKDAIDEKNGLSVSLEEMSCSASSGKLEDVRVPVEGAHSVETETFDKLHLKIVPLEVNRRRAPDIDDDVLTKIRSAVRAYYPVPDVEVSVLDPEETTVTGTMYDAVPPIAQLLNFVRTFRRSVRASDNEYYVGLHSPTDSRNGLLFATRSHGQWCKERGCTLGLAPLNQPRDTGSQIGVGAFWDDPEGYETIVHELGHAHGVAHAPCGGPDDIDRTFPDPEARTGAWGWDRRTNTLKPPSSRDVMGYCQPTWISAHNYRLLALRTQAAKVSAQVWGTRPASYREILWAPDGTARWASDLPLDALEGAIVPAAVHDAKGAEIARIELGVTTVEGLDVKFIVLPVPEQGWETIVWAGGDIALSHVQEPY